MSQSESVTTVPQRRDLRSRGRRVESPLQRHGSNLLRHRPARMLAAAAVPVLVLLAGCGGSVSGGGSGGTLSVSPGTATIDTNCTGCNATSNSGVYEQFTATFSGGGSASVTWTVSGGDSYYGPGSITSAGQYSPPFALVADNVKSP